MRDDDAYLQRGSDGAESKAEPTKGGMRRSDGGLAFEVYLLTETENGSDRVKDPPAGGSLNGVHTASDHRLDQLQFRRRDRSPERQIRPGGLLVKGFYQIARGRSHGSQMAWSPPGSGTTRNSPPQIRPSVP